MNLLSDSEGSLFSKRKRLFQFQIAKMRKTKLIILPTKCLNQMGFLLLFLSCPVIGDWGRIRPESEMSQWSIQIEREGSCGLVRDSSGVKNDITPNGLMECHDAALRNNTLSRVELNQDRADSISYLELPIRETSTERWATRSSRVEMDAERRMSRARKELQERSSRNSIQARQVRTQKRTSLDGRNAFGSDISRREIRQVRHQERDGRENRMSRSLDRRVESRRALSEGRNVERMKDSARRLSASRREWEVREVRINFEAARRKIESGRYSQAARLSQSRDDRRVEERRLTRRVQQDERNDANKDSERRHVARRDARRRVERMSTGELWRMERRERREEDRVVVRRASKERVNQETTERQTDERLQRSSERITRTSNTRERDVRMVRRNSAAESRMRDSAEINRRKESSERNMLQEIRRERRNTRDSRRIESDLLRKQEMRVSIWRMDKPEERRNFISSGMKELLEKSPMTNFGMRYDKQEQLAMKSQRWEFLDGLKNWFGQKNVGEENWVSNHGDFATTCLVGAAVYFLTTRQVKTA